MDKNYIELYSKDGKEGVNIKGQDVILLDAPEVRLSPDTPLLTNAQDVAGAINELFQLDPGGGDEWQRPSDWPQLGEPADNEIIILLKKYYSTAARVQINPIATVNGDVNTYAEGNVFDIDWGDGTVETITTSSTTPMYHVYSTQNDYYIVSIKSDSDCYLYFQGRYKTMYDIVDVHIGKNFKLHYQAFSNGCLHHIKCFGWQPSDFERLQCDFFIGYNVRVLYQIETTMPWTFVPQRMFMNCKNLKTFDFSEVTEIKANAFNNSNICGIFDAPNLTVVGDYGFGSNVNIETLNAPILKKIGQYAFYRCYSLKSINTDNSYSIGLHALDGCFNF